MKKMFLVSFMAALAACGPQKKPLMAECRASMGHSDPRWSPREQFEICMSSKDYHLESSKDCVDRKSGTPTPDAIYEPKCWFSASSNMP
jgi:hypothetical protein